MKVPTPSIGTRDQKTDTRNQEQETRIALLGFGNVARAFVDWLRSSKHPVARSIHVTAVSDSNAAVLLESPEQIHNLSLHKSSGLALRDFPTATVFDDYEQFFRALLRVGVRTVVESLATNIDNGQPALDMLKLALRSGLNVVTVDKGPLVHGFKSLQTAAREGSSRFAYTGTTGVAPPDDIVGERVIEIRGVLNGTTNYILNELRQSDISFAEALARTQQAGIAEPDPRLDIEGFDTACKILILASSLMGARASLAEVSRTGIGDQTDSLVRVAKQSGRVTRLVGRARFWHGRVRISVTPKLVGADSPFYELEGTSKAAVFKTESGRELISFGRSGRDAISEAIFEDVLKTEV